MSKTVTLEQLLESARKSEALSVQIAQAAQVELEGKKASGWKPFHAGTSAPADTTQLWIDTTNKILKYHDGSAWVAVPVAWG